MLFKSCRMKGREVFAKIDWEILVPNPFPMQGVCCQYSYMKTSVLYIFEK